MNTDTNLGVWRSPSKAHTAHDCGTEGVIKRMAEAKKMSAHFDAAVIAGLVDMIDYYAEDRISLPVLRCCVPRQLLRRNWSS